MSENPSTGVAEAEAALRHLVHNRQLLESLTRTQTRAERTMMLQNAGLQQEYPAADLALAVMGVMGHEIQDAIVSHAPGSEGHAPSVGVRPDLSTVGTIGVIYGTAAGTACLIAAAALA